MFALLRLNLLEALKTVAPLIGVVTALQIAFVHAPAALFLQFLAGSALASLGILLLFAGIDMGILPMGRFIGAELPRKGSLSLIILVAFALGFAATVAEPDVLVLASQVETVSQGALGGPPLTYVIACGVGAFTALGLLRIVWGFPVVGLLAAVYAIMIALSLLAPARIVPLAHDAGSVTTGVLTAPVVLALALGLATVLAGRSAVADGFGLLGLGSVGSIIAVLLMGLLA
jgi:hypothetical protein